MSVTAADCFICPVGRYAPTAVNEECIECQEGDYTGVDEGATSCSSCDAGKFSPGLSVNCTICPAGKRCAAKRC